VLEVEDLTVNYGAVRALQGVSFQAAEGSITAVLGANGAGKSTLLRTISGLVRPARGRVRYDGRDISRLPAEDVVRTEVAHVPEPGFDSSWTHAAPIRALTRRDTTRPGGM
jgi:branched-chain amino acid transport system ATP-binding protein